MEGRLAMGHLFLRLVAFASICLGAMAAGAPGARAASESVLYSFKGSPGDGAVPAGALLYSGGVLYGTTTTGGNYIECGFSGMLVGCGTAFSVTTNGDETVLHNFGASANDGDGLIPNAPLIEVGGAFYGSTFSANSTNGGGAIYKLTPDGVETVIYTFLQGQNPPDGYLPVGGLTQLGNTLYGTTNYGGGEGTVFSVTLDGTEAILHYFGGQSDGAIPSSGLIYLGGTFYGVTAYGGRYNTGTIFKITPDGTESVLYEFRKLTKLSSQPLSIIASGRALFGITSDASGFGTVFKISTDGRFRTYYVFTGGADGEGPTCLISVGKTLYGTTQSGGASGHGTIFKISSKGQETVLYSFKGGKDGSSPNSLINVGGTFYGTTQSGGSANSGTVFAFTP